VNHSISFKFNLVNSLCVLVMLVLFGSYNYSVSKDTMLQQLERQTDAAMQRLQKNLPNTIWNYETGQMAEIVKSELTAASLKGIFIYDDSKLLSGMVKEADGFRSASQQPAWDDVREQDLFFDGAGTHNKVGRVVLLLDDSSRKELMRSALITQIVQIVIMLAILCVAGSLLLKMIVLSPLVSLRDTLRNIASGQGDLTRRLKAASNDEIGALSQSFNVFVEQIHHLVSGVIRSASSMQSSTRQITAQAKRTSQGALQQKQETEMVATSMNEMSATADDVSRSAAEAAAAAEKANGDAKQAIAILDRAMDAINLLATRIDRGADAVGQVEKDVRDITTVLAVIRGIADQTNLLALNAAIEAARAGEQGRGFAVVADEVRALAAKTQNCTDEIQNMITRLQQGTGHAVTSMTESRNQGVATVDLATQASTQINQIANAISIVNDMNTQIASAAEEQTAVTREINENLDRIFNVASETAASAEESQSVSDQLMALEKEMNLQVSKFKV
jgi:methyl-accepting chemotaxis protein